VHNLSHMNFADAVPNKRTDAPRARLQRVDDRLALRDGRGRRAAALRGLAQLALQAAHRAQQLRGLQVVACARAQPCRSKSHSNTMARCRCEVRDPGLPDTQALDCRHQAASPQRLALRTCIHVKAAPAALPAEAASRLRLQGPSSGARHAQRPQLATAAAAPAGAAAAERTAAAGRGRRAGRGRVRTRLAAGARPHRAWPHGARPPGLRGVCGDRAGCRRLRGVDPPALARVCHIPREGRRGAGSRGGRQRRLRAPAHAGAVSTRCQCGDDQRYIRLSCAFSRFSRVC